MSHTVTVQTQVRDPVAISTACARLQLPAPVAGTHKLFNGEANGLAVQLPDWTYPVVCQIETGDVHFDHFEGNWGDVRFFDQFMQMYAVEKARLEAQRKNYSITEQMLADGSIKLSIHEGR